MGTIIQIFEGVTVGVGGIILVTLYFWFLGRQHEHKMRQVEQEQEQSKVRFRDAVTQGLSTAVKNRANVRIAGDAIEINHWAQPVAPHTYSPHIQIAYPSGQAGTRVTEVAPEEQKQLLPGPCDFADTLRLWRPSQDEILLALSPGGQPVTVPMKALCHVALVGATGGGKSSLMRLLLSQLIYCGAQVVLADPHFTRYDLESEEDWQPIADRLAIAPAVSYEDISETLRWLALGELPKRLELRRKEQPTGAPYFLAMDELPAIVSHLPESHEHMATLLREGRKVGLFLVSAAQDFLVKSIGGTGAVRDCFRTAFYVGGDPVSARVLLDIKGKVDDGNLGKGLVMMRSAATPKADFSRVPYASNDALYRLLPTSNPLQSDFSATSQPLQNVFTDEVVEASTKDTLQALDARSLRILDMLRSGKKQGQIIKEVYGVSGGAKYTDAANEIAALIAESLRAS